MLQKMQVHEAHIVEEPMSAAIGIPSTCEKQLVL